MATVINTTFRFKRGTAARWAEVNPILEQGEPGFVYDTNQLKIGDGLTHWNDLPFIGKENGLEEEIMSFDYSQNFPEIGNEDIIYKAKKEQSLYQFNSETQKYEKLSDGKNIDNITIINGGKANG